MNDLSDGEDAEGARREHKRQVRRSWDAAHPELVREYSQRYRDNNRDRINAREADRARRVAQKKRAAKDAEVARLARAENQRDYRRRYREAHQDRIRANRLELQRAWAAKQLAIDPDGFRAKRNSAGREWRAKNREEYNLAARERQRANPTARLEYQAAYRETHREELRAKRRATYAADPEKVLKYNREWKARERRRIAVGLPARRIHRTTTAQRKGNEADATAFFSKARTDDALGRLQDEQPTSIELIAAMERQHARLRAQDGRPVLPPYALRKAEREERARLAESIRAQELMAAELAEEARLDEIAREVNSRLRVPPIRRGPPIDLAAPHTLPGGPSTGGLGR